MALCDISRIILHRIAAHQCQLAFMTCLRRIDCATMVPIRMKSCPKTFLSMLSFYENDAVAGIFPFYFFVHGTGIWQRLVHRTRALRHLHLLVAHCFVIARHAHCCLPCPPNRDDSRSASLSPTVRSVPITQPRWHLFPQFFLY